MKKIFSVFILLIMVLSLVSSVFAVEYDGDKVGEVISDSDTDYIKLVENEDSELGYQIYEKKSLFQDIIENLFGSQKAFTGVEATDVLYGYYGCIKQSTHGTYEKPPFKDVKSGSMCGVGDYITYTAHSGDLSGLIWAEAWFKSSTSDLPNMRDYFTDDKNFTYSYNCYECSYLTISPDAEVDIYASSITNNGELVLNQNYEILVTLDINGLCEGCVVETGFEEYGTSYSVIDTYTGACGDDATVGYQFTQDGGYLTVRLNDKATKLGNWKVPVKVWNGCYDDLGADTRLLDSKVFNVQVSEKPQTINCWTCDGTNAEQVEITGDTCSGDYYNSEPTCDDGKVNCFYCGADNQVKLTTVIDSTCAENGYYDDVPECNTDEDDKPCYYCVNTVMKISYVPLSSQCQSGTSSEPITCDDNRDKCYYCVGEELREEYAVNGDCGVKSTEPLTCEPNDETICYSCVDDVLKVTITKENTCPSGTSINKLVCGDNEVCGDGICSPNEYQSGSCDVDCKRPPCVGSECSCDDSLYAHENPDECLDPTNDEWIYYVVGGVVTLSLIGLLFFINPKGKKRR